MAETEEELKFRKAFLKRVQSPASLLTGNKQLKAAVEKCLLMAGNSLPKFLTMRRKCCSSTSLMEVAKERRWIHCPLLYNYLPSSFRTSEQIHRKLSRWNSFHSTFSRLRIVSSQGSFRKMEKCVTESKNTLHCYNLDRKLKNSKRNLRETVNYPESNIETHLGRQSLR